VAEEEPLGLDQVMTILDEASQVIAYSHQLENKQRELEQATRDLRAANQRLQELDRLKDDFVSMVTHELRTPLTSIRAFSEILHDHPDIGEAERHRFLGLVIKESERLTRLINQVLDLAKLESGHAEWQSAELDLAEIVADAVSATSQIFKSRGVSVATLEGPRVPPVVADRDRVMQVMLNLLSNAVKFSPEGTGRVEVRLSEAGSDVRIDVRDNGVGIGREHVGAIFEKFRQVGDTLTDKPPGTGLGLAICRQIVEHFGGRLWVESEPGRGSVFSFTVPVFGAEAQSRPPLILVAAGDEGTRREVRRVAAEQGYATHDVADGVDAVEAALRLVPAAVVVDRVMPRLGAGEVAERLKESPATEGVPVFVLAEHGELGDRSGLFAGFVPRPLDRDRLADAFGSLKSKRS